MGTGAAWPSALKSGSLLALGGILLWDPAVTASSARTQDREWPCWEGGDALCSRSCSGSTVPDQVWTGLRTVCISKLLWALQMVTLK